MLSDDRLENILKFKLNLTIINSKLVISVLQLFYQILDHSKLYNKKFFKYLVILKYLNTKKPCTKKSYSI